MLGSLLQGIQVCHPVRAARLAAHWAGMCLPPSVEALLPPIECLATPSNCHPRLDLGPRKDNPSSASGSWVSARDDKSEFIPSKPLPLKTADPPPDLLTDAPEDETNDLLALHDIAYRAAEAFPGLCG